MEPRELQKLNHRHIVMVDLAAQGLSVKEIAETLGVSATNVQLVMKTPLFQNELARRRSEQTRRVDTVTAAEKLDGMRILNEHQNHAAKTMVELLVSNNERVRLDSAKEILDRVYGREFKSQGPVVVLNAERVQVLMKAITEAQNLREKGKTTVQGEPPALSPESGQAQAVSSGG